MKFSTQELEELAVEASWLKLYSKTTGKMVDNTRYQKVTAKSNKKIVIDEAQGSGIVFKDELTAMGKSS